VTDPQTIIAVDGAPNLAVDVLPDNEPGTFLVDASEVDGFDLLGWGADGWANIVCDVTRVSTRRGMTRLQGALTRTEAGTMGIELLDTERRFDPMVNADAVHPGSSVRLRVWAGSDPAAPDWQAVLFTGRISGGDYLVRYQQDGPPIVTFSAVDVVGPLAGFDSIGRADPGVGAGDTLLGRVARVLDEVGLPPATLAADPDPNYVATLASSSLAGGWEDITAAVDAELGRVWVTVDDQIAVRARGSELTGPVRGTLSDWHGEALDDGEVHCCYVDPEVRFGTDSLVNRAIGARRVPDPGDGSSAAPSVLVQVDDAYSQARWSNDAPVTHRDTGLELQTDEQVRPWAEWLVLAASAPELRVDSVSPRPDQAGPEAWQAACQTDIGDRWIFRLHPALGDSVAETLGVVGIAHDITPEGWSITWTTMRAPTPGDANPSGWFTVDLSDLDSEDVLPPFGGLVLS